MVNRPLADIRAAAPARFAQAVEVPSSGEVTLPGKGSATLYVGTTGDLEVIAHKSSESVVLKQVSGWIPICVKKIVADGTDAADIVALW